MFLTEVNRAVAEYQQKQKIMESGRTNIEFFKSWRPTAIGWKTQDLAEFDRIFLEVREFCDQVHLGWVNDRWLASMHLKDTQLESGITIIKLMQRRPGSSDAIGLDHIDFLVLDGAEAKQMLKDEAGLKWTEETNNPHCNWISVWFDNTEAKLRDNTVLDVCISELRETNSHLL